MSIKEQTKETVKEVKSNTPRWVYGVIGAGALAAVGYISWKAFEKSAEVAADVVEVIAENIDE